MFDHKELLSPKDKVVDGLLVAAPWVWAVAYGARVRIRERQMKTYSSTGQPLVVSA